LKIVAIKPTAKVCRVMGTGPMEIVNWDRTARKAAPIAGRARRNALFLFINSKPLFIFMVTILKAK